MWTISKRWNNYKISNMSISQQIIGGEGKTFYWDKGLTHQEDIITFDYALDNSVINAELKYD